MDFLGCISCAGVLHDQEFHSFSIQSYFSAYVITVFITWDAITRKSSFYTFLRRSDWNILHVFKILYVKLRLVGFYPQLYVTSVMYSTTKNAIITTFLCVF